MAVGANTQRRQDHSGLVPDQVIALGVITLTPLPTRTSLAHGDLHPLCGEMVAECCRHYAEVAVAVLASCHSALPVIPRVTVEADHQPNSVGTYT